MINCMRLVAVRAPVNCCCWWMRVLTSLETVSVKKLNKAIVCTYVGCMGIPLVWVNRIWKDPLESGGTWTLVFMLIENLDIISIVYIGLKKVAYHFASAACKGESPARRVRERAVIVNHTRIKNIGGNNVLQVLNELDSSIPVLQFGVKSYVARDIYYSIIEQRGALDLPTTLGPARSD